MMRASSRSTAVFVPPRSSPAASLAVSAIERTNPGRPAASVRRRSGVSRNAR